MDPREIELLLFEECLDKNKHLFLYPSGLSMEPFINSKDKVFIQRIDGKKIKEGEIVVFYPQKSKSQLRIHRVIKIYKRRGKYSFLVKGDACFIEDGFIREKRIIGRVTSITKKKRLLRLNTKGMEVLNYLLAKYSFCIWYGYKYFVRKILTKIKHPQINNLLFKIFWTSMIEIPKIAIGILLGIYLACLKSTDKTQRIINLSNYEK